MKAIRITKFGGPEVLQVVDVPIPKPKSTQLRVRVEATAVNRADLLQCAGKYPAPSDVPQDVPGLEFVGEIDAIGSNVTSFHSGQRVFGIVGGGSYAEYVLTDPDTVISVPDELNNIEAAAVPEAYMTALDALVTQADLRGNETVLIHAAASGVGTAAVQIARALHAKVIGTTRSAAKLPLLEQLGVSHVIISENKRFAQSLNVLGVNPHVILDLVGGGYVQENLKCVALKGRIIVVGSVAGRMAALDLGQLLPKRIQLRGTVLRSRTRDEKITVAKAFRQHIIPWLSKGIVRPVVDRIFPLEEAALAHEYVSANKAQGKIVLTVPH